MNPVLWFTTLLGHTLIWMIRIALAMFIVWIIGSVATACRKTRHANNHRVGGVISLRWWDK